MARGFLYLVAVIDWYSRKVLSWRLSNTLEPDFCVAALHEAVSVHGKPEIFNTDQGSQFTSEAFTGALRAYDIRISMDGKGRWIDNVMVERLWRSLKYEEVYLKAYETVTEARESITTYFRHFNEERRHQGLGRRTPDEVFHEPDPLPQAARTHGRTSLIALSRFAGPLLSNRGNFTAKVVLEATHQMDRTHDRQQHISENHCLQKLLSILREIMPDPKLSPGRKRGDHCEQRQCEPRIHSPLLKRIDDPFRNIVYPLWHQS
jgi:hypothetical protein